jgi:hypothetical protein
MHELGSQLTGQGCSWQRSLSRGLLSAVLAAESHMYGQLEEGHGVHCMAVFKA